MEAPADDHAARLGERLRHVRAQQGLSLHDVEHRSGGELKASVVGAYERGERTISITRLERLAEFYRVHVGELLRTEAADGDVPALAEERVVLDLVALEQQRQDRPVLRRYVDSIRSRRGDYNGQVLTVRAADLQTLAAVLDTSAEGLREELAEAGLLR